MAFLNGIKELAYGLKLGVRFSVFERHSMIERTVFPKVNSFDRS